MRTHAQIVRDVPDLAAFAEANAVSIHTARSWIQRNRIPGDIWQAFADAKLATLDELAAAASARREMAKAA